MAQLDDWRAAAEQLSSQKYNQYINSNQGLLNSINAQKEAELQSLQNANTQAINTLNQNKVKVNQTALDNAKQENINRLLSLRDNRSAMARAGLSSQGIVGSQVNSINNNYGRNLNTILKDKATGLRDIDTQINNTNLTYETNRNSLAAQYAATYAQKESDIRNTALQIGQQAYNDYIAQQQAMAQFEYQKMQAEREYQLSLANLRAKQASSNAYGFSSSESPKRVNTDYWQGEFNEDVKYGTFGTKDKNGNEYQPNNIRGKKLKSTGKKAGQIAGKNVTNSSGVNIANQTVWKLDGKNYIWNGSKNEYEEIGW